MHQLGYKFFLVDGKLRHDKLWKYHLPDMSEYESDSELNVPPGKNKQVPLTTFKNRQRTL